MCRWNTVVIAFHCLKLSHLLVEPGLKPPIIIHFQDYTNLKTKIEDTLILYKYKSEFCQNRNVSAQLATIVGGTGVAQPCNSSSPT